MLPIEEFAANLFPIRTTESGIIMLLFAQFSAKLLPISVTGYDLPSTEIELGILTTELLVETNLVSLMLCEELPFPIIVYSNLAPPYDNVAADAEISVTIGE
jgi:hypothetical protein